MLLLGGMSAGGGISETGENSSTEARAGGEPEIILCSSGELPGYPPIKSGCADMGSDGLLAAGGRPRPLPLAFMLFLQADDTTFAPCRRGFARDLDGVRAVCGSVGSPQNAAPGPSADDGNADMGASACQGYADCGICMRVCLSPWTGGNTNALAVSGCAVHGSMFLILLTRLGERSLALCAGDLFRSSSGFLLPRLGLMCGSKARKAMSSSAATPSRPSSAMGFEVTGTWVQ